MLRSALYNLHEAMYTALKDGVTTSAITGAEIAILGGYIPKNTTPPYAMLGEFVEQEYSSKTWTGSKIVAALHLYSDFEGMDELHDLSDQVIRLLIDPRDKTKSPLVLTDGFLIVEGSLRLNQTIQDDTEGLVMHGVVLTEFTVIDEDSQP